ncbi:MAG: hypothetical protein U0840_12990 [Gemmataceae bacterium]
MARVSVPAREAVSSDSAGDGKPVAYLEALDELRRRGRQRFHLTSGEPARHPDFAWMLNRALEQGMSLVVHSGGLLSNAAVRKLERLAPEQVTLVVPAMLPGEAWPHELIRQVNLFVRLGPRLQLAVPRPEALARVDELIDWIDAYQLVRRILVADSAGARTVLGPDRQARAQRRGVDLEQIPAEIDRLDLLPDGRVVTRRA